MSLLKFVQGKRHKEEVEPNIVCIKAYVDQRTITIHPRESLETSETGSIPPASLYPVLVKRRGNNRIETYDFAHVVFENKKKPRVSTFTAEKVMAHIVFLDKNGGDILGRDFIGRWGKSIKQPKSRQDLDIEENNHWVDMSPNGVHYELDISMKHESEDFCFAFNNTSYWYPEYRGWENKLDGGEIFVMVVLMGSNIDPKEFTFLLTNKGKNRHLEISTQDRG